MFDSKPIDTPMGTNSKLAADEVDPLLNQIMYRGIIGSLLYLTARRSEIVYSVGMCARFLSMSLRFTFKGCQMDFVILEENMGPGPFLSSI